MSITVNQGVASLLPAYNDAVYVLQSTNVAQPNFKFVVDYYVAGVKVDRQLIPPHPTTSKGYVNIAPILESRVSKNIATADNRILANTESYLDYVIKFGEAYGTTGTIIYPDLHVTGTKTLWNSVFDYEDFVDYSSGDYICSTSTPAQFLTNKPSSGDIIFDDRAWLHWIDLNLQCQYAYIVTRDSTGMTLNTFKVDNKFLTTKFLRIPSGCANLNIIPNAQFTLGSQPVILGSEDSYSIQLFDISNNAISDRYYYTIVNNCQPFEKRRLQFLNKLGGYDFFDFTLASKENADIERSTYKKNLGTVAGSSFLYTKNDRGYSQFHTRLKDKVSIQSDWVSESVYAWLEELVSSPDVYLDDGTNLIPINITNPNYEKKKQVNEKLFNLTIEYTLSYDRYRQRL